jgi:AAA domain
MLIHPLICDYISGGVYDGRLKSDNPAASQQLILQRPRPPLVPAGLRFAGIAHAGNSQSSAEEGKAILDVYRSLVGHMYQDRDGNQRIIGAVDILVVTPYNAQVNLLTRMLPAGARVHGRQVPRAGGAGVFDFDGDLQCRPHNDNFLALFFSRGLRCAAGHHGAAAGKDKWVSSIRWN